MSAPHLSLAVSEKMKFNNFCAEKIAISEAEARIYYVKKLQNNNSEAEFLFIRGASLFSSKCYYTFQSSYTVEWLLKYLLNISNIVFTSQKIYDPKTTQ